MKITKINNLFADTPVEIDGVEYMVDANAEVTKQYTSLKRNIYNVDFMDFSYKLQIITLAGDLLDAKDMSVIPGFLGKIEVKIKTKAIELAKSLDDSKWENINFKLDENS